MQWRSTKSRSSKPVCSERAALLPEFRTGGHGFVVPLVRIVSGGTWPYTVGRVPPVVTPTPRQRALHSRKHIIESPRYDDVVVDTHDACDHDHAETNS